MQSDPVFACIAWQMLFLSMTDEYWHLKTNLKEIVHVISMDGLVKGVTFTQD